MAISLCGQAESPAQYRLEVKDFSELKLQDGVNVNYHCSADSAGWAYFTCDPEISSSLIFSNNKSSLHIQVATEAVGDSRLPTIDVYSTGLTKVENSADSTLRILNNTPVQTLKVRVIGNGEIIVHNAHAGYVDAGINTGKGHIAFNNCSAEKAKLSNVGTGPIEAGGLDAKDVKVMKFGTGNIDCVATHSLSLYGAGTGKVYYTGNPEKITNRSLGVKAVQLGVDADDE